MCVSASMWKLIGGFSIATLFVHLVQLNAGKDSNDVMIWMLAASFLIGAPVVVT